jgi:hypothetical protein
LAKAEGPGTIQNASAKARTASDNLPLPGRIGENIDGLLFDFK